MQTSFFSVKNTNNLSNIAQNKKNICNFAN